MGIILTYTLPRLSSKIINYPETLPEVTDADDTSDPEKGKQVRAVQIKGKTSIIWIVQTQWFLIFAVIEKLLSREGQSQIWIEC